MKQPRLQSESEDAIDRDLLRLRNVRLGGGDFETLYRDFYPRLYDFLQRILRHHDDVEELINDTMFVVWNKAGEFRERSKVSTWIFGIAYKMALKRLQANKRRAQIELEALDSLPSPRDPAELVDAASALVVIRAAIAGLPLAQRTIVQLALFYGYGYAEIASIVDCPVGTVKTRMFYARERLRPLLDKLADLWVDQEVW